MTFLNTFVVNVLKLLVFMSKWTLTQKLSMTSKNVKKMKVLQVVMILKNNTSEDVKHVFWMMMTKSSVNLMSLTTVKKKIPRLHSNSTVTVLLKKMTQKIVINNRMILSLEEIHFVVTIVLMTNTSLVFILTLLN